MFKIKVERIVRKPIDKVFEALSDHASYGSFKAVGVAKLVTRSAMALGLYVAFKRDLLSFGSELRRLSVLLIWSTKSKKPNL